MIDELKHFLLIVERGTFTEAARHAHLSQPALTASIHRLETHFGARLLHRGTGGATPTAAGAALVPRAHRGVDRLPPAAARLREVLLARRPLPP